MSAFLFAALTVILTYLQIACLPWSDSTPWQPSEHDLVSLSAADITYKPWMTTLLSSLPQEVWVSEEKTSILMKRKDELISFRRHGDMEECGVLQKDLDVWLQEMKDGGISVSPHILKNKPIFCDMAPIRLKRVPGHKYFADSSISQFLLGSDGIGAFILIGSLLALNAFVTWFVFCSPVSNK